jgi:hypothetical protein
VSSGFHFQIRSALRSQLRTVTGYPGDSLVAWEGLLFQRSAPTVPPAAPVVWIRETFMPSSEQLVATGYIEALGLVQFGVCYQANQGIGAADDLADAIIASFRPGLTLANLVWITQAQRARSITEADWIQVPVSIYWRAFRQNS